MYRPTVRPGGDHSLVDIHVDAALAAIWWALEHDGHLPAALTSIDEQRFEFVGAVSRDGVSVRVLPADVSVTGDRTGKVIMVETEILRAPMTLDVSQPGCRRARVGRHEADWRQPWPITGQITNSSIRVYSDMQPRTFYV